MIKMKKLETKSFLTQRTDQLQLLTPATKKTMTIAASPEIGSTNALTPMKTEQKTDLLKLDIDCIAKVFDYLSLKDLIDCAQTCTQMQAVAGHVFQLHYPFANAIVDDGHVYVDMNGTQYCIDIFTKYVRCIMFMNITCDHSKIQWHQFKSVKYIMFHYSRFDAQQIRSMKNILRQAESIMLMNCQVDDGSFQGFLKQCHQIKQLAIGMIYNCGTNWLRDTYPTLKIVGIGPILRNCGELREFQQFVHQNPNISTFAFSSRFLFDNKSAIITAKFEDLHITLDDEHFQAFCILMHELYKKGVYQRLHMRFFEYLDVKQQLIDQLSTINGLIGFRLPFNADGIDLNSLVNLEMLEFLCNPNQIRNLPQLPQNLTHLKEIHFHKASVDDILPFLTQSAELKKISVGKITNSADGQWIDLHAVNEKRRKLFETPDNVSKVTIYIVEDIYLRTRLKSTTMSLRFVEMQRFEQDYIFKV